jgi:cytochrome c553
LLLVLLSLLAGTAQAAGDVTAGQQRAQVCGACHGANGVSTMPGVPSLAGQTDAFLQWQLVFFRSERRQNAAMRALAANLTDADIRNLGAYYASLPWSTAPAAKTEDAALHEKGEALAGQYHCANCHMDNFRGKAAAASLADQREDYLVHALADYRSAARPSTGVAAMTEAASGLSDDDITALAHYLASL